MKKLFKQKIIPERYREEFFQEINKIELQYARIVTILGAFLVLVSVVLDYFINPHHLALFFIVRSILSFLCLGLFILTYLDSFKRFANLLVMLEFYFVGAGIAYMVRVLGYDDPYYAGLNLIYLASMLLPWGSSKTTITCLGIYSFYITPILLFDMPDLNLSIFVNNNVFQIETIIIAIVVNYFQSERRNNEILNRLIISNQAKDLEERNKEKSRFISNITHELKTPLSIVIGQADILNEKAGRVKLALEDEIQRIQWAAFQLANHVDRIIEISKIDDPESQLNFDYYDYIGIAGNICNMFHQMAASRNISLKVKLPEKPLVVNIDIIRIEEVLTNLIQNALKYTAVDGSVTVTVSTNGHWVQTEISDTGAGIPQDRLDKVFERLYQADEVLSKRHGGIGVGLYLCKRNVERHGGTITVHSVVGKGSSFQFKLPVHIDQAVQLKNDPFSGPDQRYIPDRRRGINRRGQDRKDKFEYIQGIGMEDLAKMVYTENILEYENRKPSSPSILIVEDNEGMMKVIVDALSDEYNLLLAKDGFEALDKLGEYKNKISLILSDIMMPGISGFEFCEEVMSKARWKHIPLIFITALLQEEDQLRGYRLGATDYIVKPYNIKILREKVNHWILRRQYELLLKDVSTSLELTAEENSKIKDIIIHEIKNPLHVLMGASSFIEMLNESFYDRSSEEEKKWWDLSRMIKQGSEAIQSVLESSNMLENNGSSNKIPTLVSDLFDDATAQTSHFFKNNIDLQIDTTSVKDRSLLCDKSMLTQVFVNMIRNAAEAIKEKGDSHKGLIRIVCETMAPDTIVIRIDDNGLGIGPEDMKELFRFKYSTKQDGTGVGLHLSKMILKLHEGSIEVESEKGIGTTFLIYLKEYTP